MDPPISSGASVHLISGWDDGRNMIRLISSGLSLGSHLVINKGFLLRYSRVFPAWVWCGGFEFFVAMAILSGFSLTEKPIGCPEIILKSPILFFLGTGGRDPTMKVPE